MRLETVSVLRRQMRKYPLKRRDKNRRHFIYTFKNVALECRCVGSERSARLDRRARLSRTEGSFDVRAQGGGADAASA